MKAFLRLKLQNIVWCLNKKEKSRNFVSPLGEVRPVQMTKENYGWSTTIYPRWFEMNQFLKIS